MMFFFISTSLFAQPVEHEHIKTKTNWMGDLSLSLLEDGASFRIRGFVEEETWMALPGEVGSWPYLIQEADENLFIVEHNGIPHTLLSKGHHDIHGMFSWMEMPTQLRVPLSIGLLQVQQQDLEIPFLRRQNRLWIFHEQEETTPTEALSITRKIYAQNIETTLSVHSTGKTHIYKWPVSLVEGSTLLNIQSNSPHVYMHNTIFMLLEEGEHTFVIEESNAHPPTTWENKAEEEIWIMHDIPQESIMLQRSIALQEESMYITDTWSGLRTQDHLLYAQHTPTLLRKGEHTQVHTRIQSKTEEALLAIPSIDLRVHTTIEHPASTRAFDQWPIVSSLLWLLLCLVLWKQDSMRNRRYVAMSSFPAIFLSSASLLFLIAISSVSSVLKNIPAKSKEIFCLVVVASWMGIIAHSISPTESISFSTHDPTSLFWIESPTVILLALVSIVGISVVLWRNLILLVILLCFFLSSSHEAFATTGFPLCSISLEEENITISGQIHQTQPGEWLAPGPVSSIVPKKISIDGQDFSAFRITEDRFLALYLEEGIFEFVIEGTYTTPFSVYFPQRAGHLNFSSSTHQVEGIRSDLSHENTLFFWKESPPDLLASQAIFNAHVYIQSTQTIIDYSIQNHRGTETYGLPSWYAEEVEIPTKESHTLFPSQHSYSWQEMIQTPSSLRFFMPENPQYDAHIYVTCGEDVLCIQDGQPVQANSMWNAQDNIAIKSISTQEPPNSLFLLPQQCYSKDDSSTCMGTRNSSLWLADSLPHQEWDIAYDRDPDTTFFVITSSHQQYMLFSALLCCVFSFLLAKNQSSRLNISEWLWISIGSYLLHPLLLPLSIIFVLYVQQWYIHLLYIVLLLVYTSMISLGSESWYDTELVLCVPTEILTYLLWIWILGIFFFLPSFQFSKQSMEVGGSESG